MLYLFLSFFFFTVNAAVVKTSELRRLDRLSMVGSNYISATALSAVAWAWKGAVTPSLLTVGLGVVGGFFFAMALFLWMGAVARAGLAVSTATLRMAVIWPMVLSMVAFSELPNIPQTAGIILALLAVVLLTLGYRAPRARVVESAALWLGATFLVAGGTGTTLKLFTELSNPVEKEALLVLIFLSAGVQCWVLMGWRRQPPTRAEMGLGAVFGVNNFLANLCLLLGLALVPGVLAFPIIQAGTLVGATLLGVAVWRERPRPSGWVALGLSVCAIVLMRL